jgi:hypothetical protein
METKQERSLELRGISVLIAVVVALMGFSAALATKPQSEAAASEASTASTASTASAYQDPSLYGLSVGDDAEADGTVEMFN